MGLMVKKLTESEFKDCDFPVLFSDEKTDRVFGIISSGKYSFKFTWHSEVVEPVLVEIDQGIYSIGIDQNFAIVDLNVGRIFIKLKLDYFLYDIKIHGGYIYVITELEVIRINRINFELKDRHGLPDLFRGIEFKGEKIEVNCEGGKIVSI